MRSSVHVAALAGLALGCAPEATTPQRSGPPDVILVSIDTLRADHCSAYGYDRPTTPFLERLAARGVLFENHMVNSNNTLVSHASILTGLRPLAHGVFDGGDENRSALAPGYRTLAEVFREAGYATGAFTTHPVWLGEGFGLDQGVDVLQSSWCDGPTNGARFLEWLERDEPGPFFAFLHFYDVHSKPASGDDPLPYHASPELIEQFAGPAPEGFSGCARGHAEYCATRYLNMITNGVEQPGPGHLEYVAGLYDAGLRQFDDYLASLFDELDARGLLSNAIVAVTSDHGEAFFEHGRMTHGGYHDEIMHVPWIVTLPEESEPRRVSDVTRSIDVAPTLLELAGLEPIGHGRSVAAAILDGARLSPVDVLFAGVVLRGRDQVSRFKLFDDPDAPTFYDLDSDPREQVNRLEQVDAARVAGHRARMRSMREEARELARLLEHAGSVPEVSPDALEQLRALGYFD
jgi:membrane-anchored protein YejM (alkaline phosphatase superfamily)